MRRASPSAAGFFALIALIAISSCSTDATPTLFLAPTMAAQPPAEAQPAPSPSPSQSSDLLTVPTVVLPTPTPPCTDGLTYVQDLTIPDGSRVAPGQLVDKQWQVSNSGTCNWDSRYGLKLMSGDAMGAAPTQPLYPARAGTEAIVRIVFTAPATAGMYQCRWQAVSPDGQPFGDAFFMEIAVAT